VVYARTTKDGRTLTLIVSGKLWRNSLIMQDVETETLWSHITGEAMEGKLMGTRLEYIPSVQTTWSHWVAAHPATKILKKEKEIRASGYADYFADPDRIGIFRSRWLMERMPGKTLIHGIVRGPNAMAIPDAKAKPGVLYDLKVGEDPVTALRTADGGIHAWLARLDGRTLHFERAGDAATMRDGETKSTWDVATGRATAGELKGKALEEIVVRTAFWFAWSQFYPNTAVFE